MTKSARDRRARVRRSVPNVTRCLASCPACSLIMKVVSTFFQPSSVVASVKANLISDNELEHLVIAKTDRIEVYELLPDRLNLECTLEVWGRITSLQVLHPNVRIVVSSDNLILFAELYA